MTKDQRRAARGALAGALLLSALARPAVAQSQASWQVSAGYSFMHDTADHVSFPLGWTVGAAHRLNGWLSIAADVDGQDKTIPAIGSDFHLAAHGFMAGGRASAKLGALIEFGQVLVGPLRTEGTAFGATDINTRWALQPGAGLDYPLNRRIALRAELDLRVIDTGQEVRVVTGAVCRFR